MVRTRAADNLGELTRMSARLEQLVQDLATSGRTAEPQVGREGQGRPGGRADQQQINRRWRKAEAGPCCTGPQYALYLHVAGSCGVLLCHHGAACPPLRTCPTHIHVLSPSLLHILVTSPYLRLEVYAVAFDTASSIPPATRRLHPRALPDSPSPRSVTRTCVRCAAHCWRPASGCSPLPWRRWRRHSRTRRAQWVSEQGGWRRLYSAATREGVELVPCRLDAARDVVREPACMHACLSALVPPPALHLLHSFPVPFPPPPPPLPPGDDDEYRVYVGSCLGALCRVAPTDTLKAVLAAGPLAPAQPPAAGARQLNGIILATAARHAAARLEEAGVTKAVQDAIARAARDEDTGVKTAAARAAARLAAVSVTSSAAGGGAALTSGVNVLQALLGPDQGGEVVRQALLAVRGLAMEVAAKEGCEGVLEPHLPALLPSMCAVLAGGAAGISKSTAEAALQKLLRVGPWGRGLQCSRGGCGALGGVRCGQAGLSGSRPLPTSMD